MSVSEVVYREGDIADIPGVYEASYRLDWPVTPQLEEGFYRSCPQAFILAEHNGKTIGWAMCHVMTDDEGLLSILIVDEAYRGQGIGKALLRRSLGALGGRNISLIASLMGAPLYKKHFGFNSLQPPMFVLNAVIIPNKEKIEGILSSLDSSVKQVPLKDVPMEQLQAYESRYNVFTRIEHLEEIRNLDHTLALITEGGALVGYGCLRHLADKNYTIGPMYADEKQYAKFITKNLAKNLPDESRLSLSYFNDNEGAKELVAQLGEANVQPLEVLFTKRQIKLSVNNHFYLDNLGNIFG